MRRRKAVIIGGSLGGLLAANLLRSIGWDAAVYERTGDDLESRGAGIGTHDALLEIMQRVGIVVDASIGVQPLSRTCFGLDSKVIHEITRPRLLSDAPGAARGHFRVQRNVHPGWGDLQRVSRPGT